MSVYDDLAQILSARYGKDVRQSIHDAIQQCYSDATGNPESVAAFANDILELQATDENINSTIAAMQATDENINSTIAAMQATDENINSTIVAMQATISGLQTTISGQFNKFFPVGSLYVTGDDTFNPNEAEGWQGTWSKIEGRFILGSSEDYAVNTVGGEATHTLTIDEMPSHNHNLKFENDARATGGSPNIGTGTSVGSEATVSTGGGQPHNNMPPYKAVYIWERTA
jgi:hypothetical protein